MIALAALQGWAGVWAAAWWPSRVAYLMGIVYLVFNYVAPTLLGLTALDSFLR